MEKAEAVEGSERLLREEGEDSRELCAVGWL